MAHKELMEIIFKLKKLNPRIYFFCALKEDLQYLIWRERASFHLHVRTHPESH